MRRKLVAAAAAAVMVVGSATAAEAITRGGEPDAGEHPYVGVMVAYHEVDVKDDAGNVVGTDWERLWRCSGTLLSDAAFLTAGHCTEPPAERVEIWFGDTQADVESAGYEAYGAGEASGTPVTHPAYDPDAFFMHDLGLVVLDDPKVIENEDGHSYGELPEVGVWDEMATKRGRKDTTVEAVGYGLQRINPQFVEAAVDKRKADLMLVDVKGTAGIPAGTSVTLSGDAARGGTCFGDSGGPLFLGTDSNVVGAVTSFGLNGNCAGIGGGYRIDNQSDLDWINGYLED